MSKKNMLTMEHVHEVLNIDIVVGPDSNIDKKLAFNPLYNELKVYVKGECIDSGNDMEAILEVYNSIGQNKKTLTPDHIKEVLESDLLIASDSASGKKLIYNPQEDKFSIYKDGEFVNVLSGGLNISRVAELPSFISEYNSLN